VSKIPEDRARELSSLSHHLQAISEREKWSWRASFMMSWVAC